MAMSDVTLILSQIEQGDSQAAEKLLPLVYDELRKLAAAKLAQEKPGQTLQATALVHEAYLRLVELVKEKLQPSLQAIGARVLGYAPFRAGLSMKSRPLVLSALLMTLLPLMALASDKESPVSAEAPPSAVIIPTLWNDHQFNLDYTVADLLTLLDAIQPEAIVVNDDTEWLRRGCPKNAYMPEVHVALDYARERSVPIFGSDTTPAPTYEADLKRSQEFMKRNPDVRAVESSFRKRLDSTTARIAREYSFTGERRDLQAHIAHIFPSKRMEWTDGRKTFASNESKKLAAEIERLAGNNPTCRSWVVLLPWEYAIGVEETMRVQSTVRLVAVTDYLPLKPAAIERRMNSRNTAWILAGAIDEWYGMWAPQAFPTERLGTLLGKLKRLAPGEPATAYLEARWLMQNRDYGEAELILKRLADSAGDAKFSFPINGKWIRPPWSSVRDKARLNLAFVYDYKGEREQALALYRELLEKGEQLNEEARWGSFVYDDNLAVVKSYTTMPYTGMPEEAFRHFPQTAKRPKCLLTDE